MTYTNINEVNNWVLRSSKEISFEEDFCNIVLGDITKHVFSYGDKNKISWDILKHHLENDLKNSSLFKKYPELNLESIVIDMFGFKDIYIDGNLNNSAILDICRELKKTNFFSPASCVYSSYSSYNEKVGNLRDIEDIIPQHNVELAFI
jgi:hypothetical protein